jgi:hypothetical protein
MLPVAHASEQSVATGAAREADGGRDDGRLDIPVSTRRPDFRRRGSEVAPCDLSIEETSYRCSPPETSSDPVKNLDYPLVVGPIAQSDES